MAQNKLEGRYFLSHPKFLIIDVHDSYTFSKDGTFTFQSNGDLGPINHGHGKYELSKKYLTINFATKKGLSRSKVNIETIPEDQKSDSVEFHFEFYDLENEMEVPATIYKFFEDKSKNKLFQSNTNGICNLILPKGQEVQTYTVSYLGYETIELTLTNDTSKSVKIGMARDIGKQIFGKSSSFKIIKFSKTLITFSDGSQLSRSRY